MSVDYYIIYTLHAQSRIAKRSLPSAVNMHRLMETTTAEYRTNANVEVNLSIKQEQTQPAERSQNSSEPQKHRPNHRYAHLHILYTFLFSFPFLLFYTFHPTPSCPIPIPSHPIPIHPVPAHSNLEKSIPPRHPLLPRIARAPHMRMRVHTHELGFTHSRIVSAARVA